jgi:hypothetical protein
MEAILMGVGHRADKVRRSIMKRVIVSAWAGFVVYALAIFIAGPAGFAATGRLERERARMSANVDELKRINRSLADDFIALGSQPGRLKLEARDLGYIAPGEKVVRLPSAAAPARGRGLAVGDVLSFDPGRRGGAVLPACAGLLAAAFVFLIVSIGSEGGRRERRQV